MDQITQVARALHEMAMQPKRLVGQSPKVTAGRLCRHVSSSYMVKKINYGKRPNEDFPSKQVWDVHLVKLN